MSVETITSIVDTGVAIMLAAVIVALAIAAARMLMGPGYADRFVAVDMLTGLVIAACALTALITGRHEFLDVAFGFALIAFVATAALAAFLEKKVGVIGRRMHPGGRQPDKTQSGETAQ